MATLTIKNVPDEVLRALRLHAAQHGHSMEAEVRDILAAAVKPEQRVQVVGPDLLISIRFRPPGGRATSGRRYHRHLQMAPVPD